MYRVSLLKRLSQGSDLAAHRPHPILLGPLQPLLQVRRRVDIEFTRKNFTVKTASTKKELVRALRLRYEVFHREFVGKKFPLGIDTDRFDKLSDLLIIIDNNTKKVVGTYRLITSLFEDEFYSAGEFGLGDFISQPGIKLELSRACVAKGYRNGLVIQLLWRGISQYMQAVGARYLFGCSSVSTMDLNSLKHIYSYLENKDAFVDGMSVAPTEKYKIQGFDGWHNGSGSEIDESKNQLEVPPLMRVYLKAGAKLVKEPALDKTYKCIDFLTILDREQIPQSYDRKYLQR